MAELRSTARPALAVKPVLTLPEAEAQALRHALEAAQVVLDVPRAVRAPVYPGMHLGTAKLVAGGQVYGICEVVAGERVDSNRITMDVRRILARWIL